MKKMHIGINGIVAQAKTEVKGKKADFPSRNLVLVFRNKRRDYAEIKMRNPSRKEVANFAKSLKDLSKNFGKI
jgi:hypothetical protein